MVKYEVDQHENVCDENEEEWDVETALVWLCAARGIFLGLDEGGEGLVLTRVQRGFGIILFWHHCTRSVAFFYPQAKTRI